MTAPGPDLVRAALAELVGPSEAMLDAGYDASHPVDGAIAYAVVDAIWRAIMGNVLGDEP